LSIEEANNISFRKEEEEEEEAAAN